jgi:hypothetical protein
MNQHALGVVCGNTIGTSPELRPIAALTCVLGQKNYRRKPNQEEIYSAVAHNGLRHVQQA